MKIQFDIKYLLLTIMIFMIEVFIALYVRDDFIRPFFGDALVVVLIYCFVRTFLQGNIMKIALAVLLFSFFVEMGQYFQLVEILGLEDYKWARIIIGTTFSFFDLIAYSFGVIFIYLLEKHGLKNIP